MLLPIPDEAPVTTIVLPSRRFAIAEAIVSLLIHNRSKMGKGLTVGARALGRTAKVRSVLLRGMRKDFVVNDVGQMLIGTEDSGERDMTSV